MALAVVFGANGFIGRHVADAMRALPEMEVLGAGLGAPLAGLERHWLDVDLLADDGRLETELRAAGPDYVVNCTGATGGTTAELIRLNVLTTAALLEALARSGIRARLVHIGSAAEYGRGTIGQPVSETAPPRPMSPYGIAKLTAPSGPISIRGVELARASVRRRSAVLGSVPGGMSGPRALNTRSTTASTPAS